MGAQLKALLQFLSTLCLTEAVLVLFLVKSYTSLIKMPPKKAANAPSKKTEQKKKEKVIEDKTFGLKNKKGSKQQKFIAQVEKQVKSGGDPKNRKRESELAEERKRKEEAKKLEEERKNLFKPVVVQQVAQGVDPKSVFCAFFKQGLCKKGDKCKFSHDPAVERKAAKRNLYEDERDKDDNMDDWDDDKLADVVKKKHGSEKSNQTDIICKFFLDAVENNKYGWFWTCPEGGTNCKYRHALPPGFVLKKDKKKLDEKKDEISLEELIEQRRAELGARTDLTPVNIESFVKWKKRKLAEKIEKEKKESSKKKKEFSSGVRTGMSGREMFMFDPKMVAQEDDDDEGGEAFDLSKMDREGEDDMAGVKVHEIKFDEYGIMDDGVDDSTADKLKAAGVSEGAVGGVTGPIDEDLFEDEDLDELEEDLTNLEV